MKAIVDWLVVSLFVGSTAMLAVYGLHLYILVFLFRRRHQQKTRQQQQDVDAYRASTPDAQWPGVTTQIPIYNESMVAVRVIEAVASMDYAPGMHQIQVLDDSTDETRHLVDRVVRRLRWQGVDIEVVRRENRQGFKAGALKNGLNFCKHDFIAIFDADFVPPTDFLRRAIPLLAREPKLACLQGRWMHLNECESWLTCGQSLGLDGHFVIEQGARAWNGLLMNFNGTAGVWRKEAILDPATGGWSADTLTEDLDLSYRVQLAGWKIDYCMTLASPAELPNNINALKAQQRRWATGGVQTAVKLLPRIWRSPIGLCHKLEATIHLTHYASAIWMLLLALLARPLLVMIDPKMYAGCFLFSWTMVIFSLAAAPVTYGYARRALGRGWSGLRIVPYMIVLGTGLSISNAIAVVNGLTKRGGEFIRTPKSGSTGGGIATNRYKPRKFQWLWLTEMLVGAYCLANWAISMTVNQWVFGFFLGIYAYAYLTIGWMSRPEASASQRRVPATSEPEPKIPQPAFAPIGG